MIKDRAKPIPASVPCDRVVENGGVEYLCGADEEDVVEFCVGDVRKRLSQHSTIPKKTFQRDPEDPSGVILIPSLRFPAVTSTPALGLSLDWVEWIYIVNG